MLKLRLRKILTLPLEFYDENNPGRIAARVAKGLSNYTWTYPSVTEQLIPKTVRVVGIFVVIGLIDWRIAGVVFVSVAAILLHSLLGLKDLSVREESSISTLRIPTAAIQRLSPTSKPLKPLATNSLSCTAKPND